MTEQDNNANPENADTTDNGATDQFETPMEQFFYHQRRALEETGKALEALLPPEFRKHGSEASREFAQGFRVLIDATIDELKKVSEKEDPDAEASADASADDDADDHDDNDDGGDGEPPKTTGKGKVKIDLD
jgi:hypothetical protein